MIVYQRDTPNHSIAISLGYLKSSIIILIQFEVVAFFARVFAIIIIFALPPV